MNHDRISKLLAEQAIAKASREAEEKAATDLAATKAAKRQSAVELWAALKGQCYAVVSDLNDQMKPNGVELLVIEAKQSANIDSFELHYILNGKRASTNSSMMVEIMPSGTMSGYYGSRTKARVLKFEEVLDANNTPANFQNLVLGFLEVNT